MRDPLVVSLALSHRLCPGACHCSLLGGTVPCVGDVLWSASDCRLGVPQGLIALPLLLMASSIATQCSVLFLSLIFARSRSDISKCRGTMESNSYCGCLCNGYIVSLSSTTLLKVLIENNVIYIVCFVWDLNKPYIPEWKLD